MNPVLLLSRNNINLTKRCVESILQQDIECRPCVVDNGSTDGTVQWAEENGFLLDAFDVNVGVSAGWNYGLVNLFGKWDVRHVLVVGNDTYLPSTLYRILLETSKKFEIPFLTGIAVDNMEQALQKAEITPITANPDFSCFFITKAAWGAIGRFNESMKHYCSDCEYHLRGHKLGIPMMKCAAPYYHERSSTLRLAPEAERIQIQEQANRDREVFRKIYGTVPGTPEYSELFK